MEPRSMNENHFASVIPLLIFASWMFNPRPSECFDQMSSDRYVVGIVLARSNGDCPIIVAGVDLGSPADLAGIKAGDHLLGVDATNVAALEFPHILKLISSNEPGRVSLRLVRKGHEFKVRVNREKMSASLSRRGLKLVEGNFLMPEEFNENEIKAVLGVLSAENRIIAHPFPFHIPLDPLIYHGGFALLV